MSTSIGTAFKSISDYKNLTSGWGSYIIIAGAVLFSLWYSILFGYMYPNTKNPDNFPAGIQKMGLLLGVGLGGCLLMAIAITLACLVWLSVEQACILNIGLSVLAIGTSVSALAISTISSR
jgi:hypothetical protein